MAPVSKTIQNHLTESLRSSTTQGTGATQEMPSRALECNISTPHPQVKVPPTPVSTSPLTH